MFSDIFQCQCHTPTDQHGPQCHAAVGQHILPYTGKAGQAVCILCSLTSACLVSLSLHLWTPQAARNDTDQGWSEHSKAKG